MSIEDQRARLRYHLEEVRLTLATLKDDPGYSKADEQFAADLDLAVNRWNGVLTKAQEIQLLIDRNLDVPNGEPFRMRAAAIRAVRDHSGMSLSDAATTVDARIAGRRAAKLAKIGVINSTSNSNQAKEQP